MALRSGDSEIQLMDVMKKLPIGSIPVQTAVGCLRKGRLQKHFRSLLAGSLFYFSNKIREPWKNIFWAEQGAPAPTISAIVPKGDSCDRYGLIWCLTLLCSTHAMPHTFELCYVHHSLRQVASKKHGCLLHFRCRLWITKESFSNTRNHWKQK